MMTMIEALAINRAVRDGGGKAEEWLRDKCNWEQRSRTSIIREYGDPRNIVRELEERDARRKGMPPLYPL